MSASSICSATVFTASARGWSALVTATGFLIRLTLEALHIPKIGQEPKVKILSFFYQRPRHPQNQLDSALAAALGRLGSAISDRRLAGA